MLDFGFVELLLIAVVAVLVLGPKEIPQVMMTLGRLVRRLQYVKYAFSQQFEDYMREADLEDIRKQVNFEEKDFDEEEGDEAYYDELPDMVDGAYDATHEDPDGDVKKPAIEAHHKVGGDE